MSVPRQGIPILAKIDAQAGVGALEQDLPAMDDGGIHFRAAGFMAYRKNAVWS